VYDCQSIGNKTVYQPQILGYDLETNKLAFTQSYTVDYFRHKAPLLTGLIKDPASPYESLIAFSGGIDGQDGSKGF